jgi:hypothetical protein
MKKRLPAVLLMLFGATLYAAPSLFTTPTQSKWSVTSGGKPVATVTLVTDGSHVRADWSSAAGSSAFIGSDSKIWVRQSSGDVDLATYRGGNDKIVVPALLLPFTTSEGDKVELKSGKASTYSYKLGSSVSAKYTWDAKGPSAITVAAGAKSYSVTRTSAQKLAANDASLYAVHPKKGAATQMSKLAGNLFGKSDTSVSATAGPRGAGEKGLKFSDGGNYEAVKAIEDRDEASKQQMQQELLRFQKEGKIGQAREN